MVTGPAAIISATFASVTNGNELVMEISQSTEWITRATLIFYGTLIDTSGVRVIVEPVNEQDIMGGSI